jgi:hypothetical protein
VPVTFEEWTGGRTLFSLGTNAGADELPFQTWRHFKEAFAPELVARAIAESKIPVKRCLDPFGGSGTAALACQFLGIDPVTVEVNPFLADLIEAKLTSYDVDSLAKDYGEVVRSSRKVDADIAQLKHLPATFVQPGVGSRWVFDRTIVKRIASFLTAINRVSNRDHRRLFRVLLGGVLVSVSNVVVNGKGRRYRGKWRVRKRSPEMVDNLFCASVQVAIADVDRFRNRACSTFELRRGDSREVLNDPAPCEIAVFSPPYPNSFDYTDVYNLELWTLGYLRNSAANQRLRAATLCSHVQRSRQFRAAPCGSRKLDAALAGLREKRATLWDFRIPEMVGGYFNDLMLVLELLKKSIVPGGATWIVVGDSRYAAVQIETAAIIAELAPSTGWSVDVLESCRSMRASAQQGGGFGLAENLLILSNR